MDDNLFTKAKNSFLHYFELQPYLVSQKEAEQAIREGVSFRGPNILILVLAILIASLGLNTNSTAVIIGAMLISPLMGPIIGAGLGVGILDFELIKRSVRNLAMAALVSVLASTVYFMISPVNEGHSELLARTSPTIYDVFIGFIGGGAGIIAVGIKSKGNVIPGVAIATALMPPLCTAGFGLATLQLQYFLGAFYLFIINSIYIAFATVIGVKLMKYRPTTFVNPARARKVRRTVYLIALVTLIPSIFLTVEMIRENRFISRAGNFVKTEFQFPATQVLGYQAKTVKGKRSITVTLIGRILPEDSLRLALTSRLKYAGLEGTALDIVQGEAATHKDLKKESPDLSLRDIYQITQATIDRQQTTIDSLRFLVRQERLRDSVGSMISPEIKVLFPEVENLAVTKAIFANTLSGGLDTVNVALVEYSRKLSADQLEKFNDYLDARLGLDRVKIVEIDTGILGGDGNRQSPQP